MSASTFAALSGIAARNGARCATPEPAFRTARPLYSKSGARCIEGDNRDPNTTYDFPVCERTCDAAGTVAIGPPNCELQHPGDDSDDPNDGGRTPNGGVNAAGAPVN